MSPNGAWIRRVQLSLGCGNRLQRRALLGEESQRDTQYMRLCQTPRKGNALSYCITRSHGSRGSITLGYPLVSAHGFLPSVALPVFPSLLLPAAAPLPAAPVAPGLCSSLLLPAAPPCCAALLPAAPRLESACCGICLLWSSEGATCRTSDWLSRSQPKVCNKRDRGF